MSSFRTRVTAIILLLAIISPYFTPSAAVYCLTEDEWVTIFDQNFSKIETVPSNIYTIISSNTEQSVIEISKKSEDNYLLITKGTDDRGTVDIFGFTPSIKCRYTIELEWFNTNSASWSGAGFYIGVGGVRLHCFSSSGGSRFYLRGQYFNASNEYNTAFVWDLGTSSRVSLTIDTDTILGKAYISYQNNKAELPFFRFFWEEYKSQTEKDNTVELPYYRYRWIEDEEQNTFTPDTILLLPLSARYAGTDDSTVIKLYRVTQKVYTPTSIVAIGSNKYQAYGYDGPHMARTVQAGMEEIRNANMNATIFADVGYLNDPTYIQYLKGLIADGWELGIHYSEGLSTMNLVNSTTLMMNEYAAISKLFGTQPLTWCSLGNLDNATYALLAKKNLNMVFRSLRVIPQNVPGSSDITNLSIDYWLGAAKSGVATVPIYVHQTEVEPQASPSSIDASKFDTWLNYVVTNGVRLTGYYKWYMINSNQLDAKFYYNTHGDSTTITVDTNGYNAIILVKIKAASVIAVWHDDQIIDYSTSPEGYIIFEVEDGGNYTVTTIDYPVNILDNVNLPLYLVVLGTIIIIIILGVKIYKQRTYRRDNAAISDGG